MTAKTYREKFLEKLKASGLNMAEVARRAGTTYDRVRDLKRRENATTGADAARAVARVLGFSADTLEDLTPEEMSRYDRGLAALESSFDRLETHPDLLERLLKEAEFLVNVAQDREQIPPDAQDPTVASDGSRQ